MAEPFDPYVDWLGLAPSSRPRNRYQILGLDNFEEDPQRIASQADAMLNRLRSVRPGPKRNVWQELLDELTLAKICLSDSSRKLHYDGQLRAEGVTASPIARPGPDEPPLPPRLNPDLFPPGMAAPPPAASSGWPPSATQPPAAETSWPKTAVEPAWPPAQSAPGFATAAIPPVLDPMFPPNPLLPPQPAAADPQLPPAASNPAAPAAMQFSGIPGAVGTTPFAAAQRAASPTSAPPTGMPFTTAPAVAPRPGDMFDELAALAPRPIAIAGTPERAGPSPLAQRAASPLPAEVARPNAPVPLAPRGESAVPTNGKKSVQNRNNQFYLIAGGVAVLALMVTAILWKPAADPATLPKVDSSVATRMQPATSVMDAADKTSGKRPAIEVVGESAADPADAAATETSEPSTADSTQELPKTLPPKKELPTTVPKRSPTPRKKPPADTPPADTSAANSVAMQSSDKPAESNPETSTAPVDPAKAAALRKELEAALHDLGAREPNGAKEHLRKATSVAETEEQRTELARIKSLAFYVEGFWKAVRESMAGLATSDELKYEGALYAVVESDSEAITLHSGAGNREYKIKTMPAALALALAERWYNQDAANKLYLGAFQAVDPKGDRRQAQRLWEQATAGGASAADLMPLLAGNSAASDDAGSDGEGASPPGDKELVVAIKSVKEIFLPQYKTAKTPERKLELAETLLNSAAETEDPTERYALLREALDLSAAGGDPPTILRVVEEIRKSYKVNSLDLKAEAFARAAGAIGGNVVAARAVTQAALDSLDDAIKNNRTKAAGKLSQAALSAARKSKSPDLVEAAKQRSQLVQDMPK